MKLAVFPGSFDPFTNGHYDIVKRGLNIFDQVIIAIGENSSKTPCFDLEQRMDFIRQAFPMSNKVIVKKFSGLTVDFCKKENAGFILRGIRNTNDFEYEKNIAEMNTRLSPGLETVILYSSSGTAALSSTILREIYKNKGDISAFVPYNI